MRGLLTIAAVVMISAAAFGQSLVFDGSADYLNITTPVELFTDDYTLSMWIYPKTKTGEEYYFSTGYNSNPSLLFYWDAIGIKYGDYNGSFSSAYFSGSDYTLNAWHHLVFARDAGSNVVKLYINGVYISSVSGRFIDGGTADHQIGYAMPRAKAGSHYTGSIADPVRIYSYALTANEVAALYIEKAAYLNYTTYTNTYASLPTPEWPLANIGGTNVLTEIPMRPSPLLPINAAIPDVWDSSGQGNHGSLEPDRATGPTWSGSVTDGSGVMRRGMYEFDGANDYIEVTSFDNAVLTDDATISAWIKPDTIGDWEGIVGVAYGPDYNWLFRIHTGGYLHFRAWAGTADTIQSPIGTIIAGVWQHVAATIDISGNTVKLYKDGVEVASDSPTFTSLNNAASETLKIGIYNDGTIRAFDGSVDDVRISESALTSNQVYNLYLNTQPTNTPILRMTFDALPYEWTTLDGQHTITAYPEGTAGPTIGE